MQTGGYFVSEQEEKAAKWEMVEKLRKAKEHLAVLKSAMKDLASLWIEFSRVLQNPDFNVFLVTEKSITVGKQNANLSRPIAEIGESNVNWESVRRLIADYQETAQNIKTWATELNLPSQY